MKRISYYITVVILILSGTAGYGDKGSNTGSTKTTGPGTINWQVKADRFLEKYLADFAGTRLKTMTNLWNAHISGKPGDFKAFSAAYLEFKQVHSDRDCCPKRCWKKRLPCTPARGNINPPILSI
jgi:hypothetical protein